MRKALKYIGIGLLVLSIVSLPFAWPFIRMIWVFMPRIPAPAYAEPATVAEARLQDIDYLSTLTQYDRSFSESARDNFAEALASLTERAASLSDAEFYLAIAEAIALADNGHTGVTSMPQYTKFATIGARLYNFADGLFVVAANAETADTVGRKVIAVNGMETQALQDKIGRFRGGSAVWRKLHTSYLIESPELLAAAGFGDSSKWVDLTLEDAAGNSRVVRFDALERDVSEEHSWRSAFYTIIPGLSTGESPDWTHALDGEDPPLPTYMTSMSEALHYDLENNGLYIRALPGFAVGEDSIERAYESILDSYPAGGLDYLVVDFRLHDGGDYTKSMDFSEAAPGLVKDDGAIYIVTGPNTFSAAIVTVAMLKYYSGDRAMIVGERLGDREQFWAERGTRFELPNSGYYIGYATGYHDWEKGCKGKPYCYTMNEMYEVPAGSLDPVVNLPQSFSSYAAGEDVVMEWVDSRH
ncbi:MAG: hypothetical protein AAGG55_06250 [Pseudomonadota bacterium]